MKVMEETKYFPSGTKKYKRFFAFGCSFTKYKWPTWADILGKSFDEYYNFAASGAGNFYIYSQVINALVEYEINENDLVIIMWSSFTREDRMKDGVWKMCGNVFRNENFDKEFLIKYADIDFYTRRDIWLIAGVNEILEKTKCKFLQTSILELDVVESFLGSVVKNNFFYKEENFLLFKKYVNRFLPSFQKVVPTWKFRFRSNFDLHPTPLEHLTYLEKILLPEIDMDISLDKNYLDEVKLIDEKVK